MKIGCFALVDAFHTLDHQLARIQELGFDCADITDNHPGGLLGGDIFDAAVSLDCNPFDIKRLFDQVRADDQLGRRACAPIGSDIAGALRHQRDYESIEAGGHTWHSSLSSRRSMRARPHGHATFRTSSGSLPSPRNFMNRCDWLGTWV